MAVIESFLFPKKEAIKELKKLYENYFLRKVKDDAAVKLETYINSMVDDLWFYVEFPYVEKFYRDAYYHFFSTKSAEYPRNCIRVSVFNLEIDIGDFRTKDGVNKLKSSFEGVFNIRPTYPHIIGWSLLTPMIFKNYDKTVKICSSEYKFLVNGAKLSIKGFPHISQDQEFIRCAEISICSIIDYFSNSYQQYGMAMPSDFYSILKEHSEERQKPTKGLEIEDITYLLKHYGLKTILYDKDAFNDSLQLANLIGYYIDSTIPVIIGLESTLNSNLHGEISSNHTIVLCGRKEKNLSGLSEIKTERPVLDLTYLNNEYVVMDDERPPYSEIRINTEHNEGNGEDENYRTIIDKSDPDHQYYYNYLLKAVVVPLPEKVYLEGSKARIYVDTIMQTLGTKSDDFKFGEKKPISKLFLTTSRSFKDHFNSIEALDNDFRTFFVNLTTSKFIWVNEIYDENGKNLALFVIDATESKSDPDIADLLIMAASNKKIFYSEQPEYEVKSILLHSVLENYARFDNYKGK